MTRPYRIALLVSIPTILLMLLTSIAFAAVDVTNPSGTALELYKLLTQAKYLPATGAGLVLFVAVLRLGLLARIFPWFKNRVGGYVVGYGSTSLLVFGTAFAAEQPFTLSLVGIAIAQGWAASGGYETAADFVRWLIAKLRGDDETAGEIEQDGFSTSPD